MLPGEIAFLALVVTAFATFIGVIGFISIWSRQPSKRAEAGSVMAIANGTVRTLKRAA